MTTIIPLQQPQHDTTSSSSSSDGEGTELFDVVINQSRYEFSRPPLTSDDVVVYVLQLVCHTNYRTIIVTIIIIIVVVVVVIIFSLLLPPARIDSAANAPSFSPHVLFTYLIILLYY